jgi:hypothetical protein
MKNLVLLLAVPLAACASINPEEIRGPNGKIAYAMKCSGFGRTLEDCYKKAGEVCPNGYNIVDRASSVVGVPSNGGTIMAPRHTLVIECK